MSRIYAVMKRILEVSVEEYQNKRILERDLDLHIFEMQIMNIWGQLLCKPHARGSFLGFKYYLENIG